MARLKQTITVLLPVFWLVTLSYAAFEPRASVWPAERTVATCPVGDAAPESGDFYYYSHDQVRPPVRRLVLDRSGEKPFDAGLITSVRPFAPPIFIPALAPADGAFLLQQRWQFVWRTAGPARAPTSLA